MKKQRISYNDQVLLRLLCLAEFVKISSSILYELTIQKNRS